MGDSPIRLLRWSWRGLRAGRIGAASPIFQPTRDTGGDEKNCYFNKLQNLQMCSGCSVHTMENSYIAKNENSLALANTII
jgi:hypothetical protein